MMDPTDRPVSLRSLELFEAIARTGSLRDSARALGMSAPAASQQLRNLERALGQALIDHGRRPLGLTQAGRAYLTHAREALRHLRQGAAALSLMDLGRLAQLRLGIIDDLDSEVTPRLAIALAGVVGRGELSLLTAPSHRILTDLAEGRLDLGVAARPPDLPEGLRESPLLRDPFVLAVPRGHLSGPPADLTPLAGLPFLRYARGQLLGRQIAAHLARLRLAPEGRIELDSNPSMFGLIASGAGWAITTPLGYLSLRRFHGQVDLHPLPLPGFARTVSLFRPEPWDEAMPGVIAGTLRGILRAQVTEPGVATFGWLEGRLAVLSPEPDPDDARSL